MYLTNLFKDDQYIRNPMSTEFLFTDLTRSRPIVKHNINRAAPIPPDQSKLRAKLALIQRSLQKTDGFKMFVNEGKGVVSVVYRSKKLASFFRSNYIKMSAKQRLQFWEKLSRIVEVIDETE